MVLKSQKIFSSVFENNFDGFFQMYKKWKLKKLKKERKIV